VSVYVRGATATFLGGRWSYQAPAVHSVSPTQLQPNPTGVLLAIAGVNFGFAQGRVAVGVRLLSCGYWSDSNITCDAPPGVAPAAVVTVTAASSRTSASVKPVAPWVEYAPPAITSVELTPVGAQAQAQGLIDGTRGGARVVVTGTGLGAPALVVSLWLVREGAVPGPSWAASHGRAEDGGPTILHCPQVPANMAPTPPHGDQSLSSVSCTWPRGSGVGWRVVAVNHDVDGPTAVQPLWPPNGVQSSPWRTSSPSTVQLAYRSPWISSVTALGPALAVGGFQLAIAGTDFSEDPDTIRVTVGSLPCVLVPGSVGHEGLSCVAPPRQVDGNSAVVVSVGAQPSASHPFSYAAPVLARVQPRVFEATVAVSSLGGGQLRLSLFGTNFGARYREGLPPNHTVTVGPRLCGSLVWASDSELSCVIEGDLAVGRHHVALTVGGVRANNTVEVVVSCPVGTHGLPGQVCSKCPTGAQCPGGDADPMALPGFYPIARAQFVACSPPEACVGGISAWNTTQNGTGPGAWAGNGTAAAQGRAPGCANNYMGVRCGSCSLHAYRLKGRCASCPNTAWLLFLLFALAIVGAVVGAVYLSKRRINMAGLSVGVVRAAQVARP
jgi:hypothetical protein